MLPKIINFYNTNAKFHSFVVSIEYAAVGAIVSYDGGALNSKTAWIAAVSAVAGAIVGAAKRWLATNVATQNLQLK